MNTKILISTMVVCLLMFTTVVAASTEQTIQAQIKHNGAAWTAGDTSVSNLSISEKKAICGAKIKWFERTLNRPLKAPKKVSAPAAFNWHDLNGDDWMTPIKNQGSCGSCWSFGVIGAFEACINIQENDPAYDVDLSEQHLTSTCCNAGDCGGGYPTGALSYLKDSGVPTEKCFPYQAKNSKCTPCEDWKNESYKIEKYLYIDSDTDSYKWALQNYGPMVVVLKVPDDWFYYKSGVYEPVWTSDKFGWANHCVVLCGWDDSLGAWIIKNSWGKYWGENGYAYVKYGTIEKYRYGYAIEKPIIPSPNPDNGKWIKPVSATASSMYNAWLTPGKAIDNNTGTYWFSTRNQTPPCWIQFDLNKSKTVDNVRAMFYKLSVPMTVEIQTSNDAKRWRSVAKQKILVGSKFVEIPFARTQCRYIRMIETNIPQKYRYAMCTEFDVHTCKGDVAKSSINLGYANGSIRTIPFDNICNVSIILNGTEILRWRQQ